MTGYWVHFDDQGRASAFSGVQSPGAEWVEGVSDQTLIACRRVKGKWIAREPVLPMPEDIEALREAERQAAEDARDQALREALAAEADPLFFKWQRGECEKQDWLDAVAAVKARYPSV